MCLIEKRIQWNNGEYWCEAHEKPGDKLNDHCWINHVEYWLRDLEQLQSMMIYSFAEDFLLGVTC